MNLQPELDRAFAAVVAAVGDSISWQRGLSGAVTIQAIASSGDEAETSPTGATVTVFVRHLDFAGFIPAWPVEGDLVSIGPLSYSVYRINAFPDLTSKCWLKRRQ